MAKNIQKTKQLQLPKRERAHPKRGRISVIYMGLAIVIAGVASMTPWLMPTTPVAAAVCDDVKIVFARGSGEHLGDVSNQAWRASLYDELKQTNLKYDFYELGSAAQNGFQYPAIAVGGSLESMFHLIGAKVSAGESYQFGESVNQGVNELEAYMNRVTAACPQTKFVLGGYSQGGMVITKALQRLDANKIVYAATFGDPKLYLPEGAGADPAACRGENLSDYRAYVPECHTEQGILGGYQPYRKTELVNKVGAWCNNQDIMCGSSVNMFNLLGGHTSYTAKHLYEHAAIFINNKLAAAFPGRGVKIHTRTDVTTQDTAILIDTTGSMSSMINRYKAEAKKLAKKTLEQGGRVALFEYRDMFENPSSTIKHCDFGVSYAEFEAELDKLQTGDGGDIKESAMFGLLHVLNEVKWQRGATKSVVLLTDAGYHAIDYDGTTLADVTKRALEIDPVNVYTIAPESLRSTYADLTAGTSGNFFNSETDLEKVADYLTKRPIAVLPLSHYLAAPGDTVTFDASESIGYNTIDHYEWDLDFDGEFETKTTTPIVQQQYANNMEGYMQVKVVDKLGFVSTMSALVTIAPPEARAQITAIQTQMLAADAYQISFQTSANAAMTLVVVNDNIVGIANGNQFTLDTIDRATTVSLVPYSSSGLKGEAKNVTVYPGVRVPNTGQITFSLGGR